MIKVLLCFFVILVNMLALFTSAKPQVIAGYTI